MERMNKPTNESGGLPMEALMSAEIAVLRRVVGEDNEKLGEWLSPDSPNGARLREILEACYHDHNDSFAPECIDEAVEKLRAEGGGDVSLH
jgi:hypothetical protein